MARAFRWLGFAILGIICVFLVLDVALQKWTALVGDLIVLAIACAVWLVVVLLRRG